MTAATSSTPSEPGSPSAAVSACNGADADWLRPSFDMAGVGALMTTRAGGASAAPFDSLNVGTAVGDDPLVVAANRRRFEATIGATPIYLRQVHGVRVMRLDSADLAANVIPEADASVTIERGIACTVQAADCMPVLFAMVGPGGVNALAVGAAHAGWRGLAAGVLDRTVDALCEASGGRPEHITTWLGPCIGPSEFEVGADVLVAFGLDPMKQPTPRFSPKTGGKWLADLPGLAADRLKALGVGHVIASGECTVSQPFRFFSFRRDRRTGRMVAAIWLD